MINQWLDHLLIKIRIFTRDYLIAKTKWLRSLFIFTVHAHTKHCGLVVCSGASRVYVLFFFHRSTFCIFYGGIDKKMHVTERNCLARGNPARKVRTLPAKYLALLFFFLNSFFLKQLFSFLIFFIKFVF